VDRFRTSTSLPLRGKNDKKKPPLLLFFPPSLPPEYRSGRRELDEGEGPLILRGVSLFLSVCLSVLAGRASSLRQLSYVHEDHYFCVRSAVVYFLLQVALFHRVRGFLFDRRSFIVLEQSLGVYRRR